MRGPRALPVREGDVLAGKYRVERVLGAGGMGVVVSATHLVLGERVALKVLLPEALDKPDVAPRFLREARTALRLQSEHVAHVLDVGVLEAGSPYLVMEHLEGADLRQLLRIRRSFEPPDAIEIGLQVADALAEAHAQGVVHRDLKPSNLFLTERADGRPVVKVLDFGIAKSVHELGEGHETSTDTFIGSPRYAAPEQLRSAKHVDARADLWSLGVVLYELVAGVRPFEGESAVAVIATIMAEDAELLRVHVPSIDPALEAAIARCLERDPARRFQSVTDLAVALRAVPIAREGALMELCHVARQRAADGARSEAGGQATRVTAVDAPDVARPDVRAEPGLPAPAALAAAAALAARVAPAPEEQTSVAVLDRARAAGEGARSAPTEASALDRAALGGPSDDRPTLERPTVAMPDRAAPAADATPPGATHVTVAGAAARPSPRPRWQLAVGAAVALLLGAAVAPTVLGGRYAAEPHEEAIPKAGSAVAAVGVAAVATDRPASTAPGIVALPPVSASATVPAPAPSGTFVGAGVASAPRTLPVAPPGGLRPRAPGTKVDPGEQRKW